MRLAGPLLLFGLTFAPACALFEPEHPTITVVKGDTLSKLARAHGVTVAQLKEWNGLSSDTIEIGQVLALKIDPSAELAPAAPPSPNKTPRRRAKGLTVRAPAASDPQAAAPASFTMPAGQTLPRGAHRRRGRRGHGRLGGPQPGRGPRLDEHVHSTHRALPA
jgi:LysM repeat protein